MAEEDRLSTSLQESIATAIALRHDENSEVMSHLVDSTFFDSPLDEIVLKCIQYRKEFKEPPGRSHIDDVLGHVLNNKSHKEYSLYNRILNSMAAHEEGMNSAYILSEVSNFVQMKQWRLGILKLGERYQKGGPIPLLIDDLDAVCRETLRIRMKLLDYGIHLDEYESANYFNKVERNHCLLGIDEFDRNGINPTKAELFLFIAARNRGKSMFLNLCGKQAVMQGWKVLHITLENSPAMTFQRYHQSFFSGVKRHGSYPVTYFEGDDDDFKIETKELKPNYFIEDGDLAKTYILKQLNHWKYKLENLLVKGYPTGRMTLDDLQKDLDDLALVKKFVPDMILLDYPQIMKLDQRRPRHEVLDDLFVNLRGLAVERNIAMVTPAQSNRAGETASTVQSQHVAGTIGMMATADNAITYSQTRGEENQGIARLYAQKVRNDAARSSVYISQHYATAQFVIDSRNVTNKVRDAVKAFVKYGPGEEEEGEDDFEEAKKYKKSK